MTLARIAFCTAKDEPSARQLARGLLDARIVACVNLLPAMESIYWWQGKIESSAEVLMMMKTAADRIDELKDFIAAHHGYDTPELVVIAVEDGLAPYLAWLENETRR